MIGIPDRAGHPELTELGPGFWLFDEDTPDAFAVMMSYGADGRWLGAEHTTDRAVRDRCRRVKEKVVAVADPLNVYLARIGVGGVLRTAAGRA